jgi:hypothetical protein
MSRFLFWQKWLLVLSGVIVVFGLALAVFNQTPVFDALFNRQINPAFWTQAEITPQISAFQQWAYGVLGATMAGWGVFILFIVHEPFRRRERWAWNCLAFGIGLWFVVDTALSIAANVIFNAAFNSLLLVLILPPLIATRTHFSAPARS